MPSAQTIIRYAFAVSCGFTLACGIHYYLDHRPSTLVYPTYTLPVYHFDENHPETLLTTI